MSGMAHPVSLLFNRRHQVYDAAALRENGAVFRHQHRASAGGQYQGLKNRQRLDGFLFPLPETLLTLFLEDIGDVDAGAPLDLRIAVAERRIDHSREDAPDSTLARAHRTDQVDVALATHRRGRITQMCAVALWATLACSWPNGIGRLAAAFPISSIA